MNTASNETTVAAANAVAVSETAVAAVAAAVARCSQIDSKGEKGSRQSG